MLSLAALILKIIFSPAFLITLFCLLATLLSKAQGYRFQTNNADKSGLITSNALPFDTLSTCWKNRVDFSTDTFRIKAVDRSHLLTTVTDTVAMVVANGLGGLRAIRKDSLRLNFINIRGLTDTVTNLRTSIIANTAAIALKLNITDTNAIHNQLNQLFNGKMNNPPGTNLQFVDGTGALQTSKTLLSQFTNDVPFLTSAALTPYLTTATAASTYQPIITASNTVKQYWNGYKNFVTLNTDSVNEGNNNLYYTTTRFNTSFSGKTTDNLAEGSSNLYFTNARSRSSISSTGTGVSYNSSTGVITGSALVSSDSTNFRNYSNLLYPQLSGSYANPSWITSLAAAKITGLATVATSGAYADLSGKPTIYSFSGTGLQYTKGDGTYATFPTSNTAFTNGAGYITSNQTIAASGDATGSGTTSLPLTLATVNSNVGTFNNVTVNGKGLVTSASNTAYLTGNQAITVTATGDATGVSSSSATAPSIALTLKNTGTAGTYGSASLIPIITTDAQGRITSVSTAAPTATFLIAPDTLSSARAFNTSYVMSATKYVEICVSASVSASLSLTGGQGGTITLQTSVNNSTWVDKGSIVGSNTGALTIGLSTIQVTGGQVCATLPPAYFYRVTTTNNTGTPTFTMMTGNKTTYN